MKFKSLLLITLLSLSYFAKSQSFNINDAYQIINTTDEFVVKDMKECPISYNFPYPANSIFAVGYFKGTISVPALTYNGNYTISSAGGKDGFVMQILYNEVVPTNTMPEITQIIIYQIGGTGDDEVNSIDEIFTKNSTNSTPEFSICGSFENSCIFYNNTNNNYGFSSNNFPNITLTSLGQKDIFYANLLGETLFSGGPFYTAQSIGGNGNEEATSISRKNNKIAITGYFENQINITGTTPYCNKSINSSGLKDIVLIMLDRPFYSGAQVTQNPNDNIWIYSFGGALNDIGSSLMFANSNNQNENLMITGYFESPTSNFNLPNQSISLTNGGANDIFIGELPINSPNILPCNSLDRWSYIYRIGSTGNDISTKIYNQENYILLAGSFEGTVNFRPTIGSPHNLTSAGSTDGFIATYRRTIQWNYNAGTFTPSNILLVPDCYRVGGIGYDIVNDIISDYFDQNMLNGSTPLIKRFAICGQFQSTATLSKSNGVQILGLTSNGGSDYYYVSFSNPTLVKPLSNITCYYNNGGLNDEINLAIAIGENNFNKIFPSFSSTHVINNTTVNNTGLDGLLLGFNCCNGYSNIRNFSGTSMDIGVNSVSEKINAMDQYIVGNYSGTPNIPLSGGGFFNTTSNGVDGIILKFDSLDQIVWATPISGNSDEYINSICEQGNYIYVGGNFYGSITVNGNTYNSCGTSDCFIACLDKSNGNIIWFKHIGGAGDDGLTSIAVSSTGIIAVGNFESSVFYSNPCNSGLSISNSSGSSGFSDIFLIGLNLSGITTFLKGIGNNNYDEQPVKIIYNSFSNSYYLIGLYQGTTTFGSNPGAITLTSLNTLTTSGFIAKYDNSGNNLFAKSIDVSGGIAITKDIFEDNNELYCIVDATGQNISFSNSTITLPGHATSNIGFSNIIIKYNLSGTVLSATQISEGLGTVLNDYMEINSIFVKNGEIYLTGVINGQIEFYNSHSLYSNYGAGDLITIRLNSNFEIDCASVIGGSSSDFGTTIINNYYKDRTFIVGNLNGNTTYGTNTLNLLSPINLQYEIIVLKFDCCRD